MVDNQALGYTLGDLVSEILFDHRQRQVDHGGHAGGCPDVAINDENTVLLQSHCWEALLQIAGKEPMGSGLAAIEQTGLGQRKGTGARTGNSPRSERGAAHKFQQAGEAGWINVAAPTIRLSHAVPSKGSVSSLKPADEHTAPPCSESRVMS